MCRLTVAVIEISQNEFHLKESAAGADIIQMVGIQRSQCPVVIGVTRHDAGFIKTRVSRRCAVQCEKRLFRRTLPVEIFRELRAVGPREHIDVIERRAGAYALFIKIRMNRIVISPTGRNKNFRTAAFEISGSVCLSTIFRLLRYGSDQFILPVFIQLVEKSLARFNRLAPTFPIVIPVTGICIGFGMVRRRRIESRGRGEQQYP